MSASHAPTLDAIALQLAAALDQYEREVASMIETWLDMELYGTVSERVEEIRMYSADLPQLSVQWVELLIAHAELVHTLWRLRFREDPQDRLHYEEVRARHAGCLDSMRRRCHRLLLRKPEAGPA
jgi:hypothetical protein